MSKKKIRRPQQYKKKPDPTFKEWWQSLTERTRKSIIYALYAVAAVIVLIFVWYYAIYDDGSLKIKNSAVVGKEDNWLIVDRGSGKNSDYYKVGVAGVPEGYTLTDEAISSSASSYKTEFVYRPAEENGVDTLYITGVSKSADDMIDSIYGTFQSMTTGDEEHPGTISEVTDLSTPSGTARYFTYAYCYDNDTESGAVEVRYSQSIVCYVPANYSDACVLVSVNVNGDSADVYLSDDAIFEELQKGIAAISID